jgi:hypothetical protein
LRAALSSWIEKNVDEASDRRIDGVHPAESLRRRRAGEEFEFSVRDHDPEQRDRTQHVDDRDSFLRLVHGATIVGSAARGNAAICASPSNG